MHLPQRLKSNLSFLSSFYLYMKDKIVLIKIQKTLKKYLHYKKRCCIINKCLRRALEYRAIAKR